MLNVPPFMLIKESLKGERVILTSDVKSIEGTGINNKNTYPEIVTKDGDKIEIVTKKGLNETPRRIISEMDLQRDKLFVDLTG